MQSVTIVGIGRLGGAIAIALSRSGYKIESLVYRGTKYVEAVADALPERPNLISFDRLDLVESDIILITSADPEIPGISLQLGRMLNSNPCVLHTSGSLSSEILSNLAGIGCTGSIHPLVSISDPLHGADAFAGSYFCVEGESGAVEVANEISKNLGGHSFSIKSELKPLYHAAAVTACGHLVSLIDAAIEMLSKCGPTPTEAQRILLPLIKSTIDNLEFQDTSEALTGTFARGDEAGFQRHLAALEKDISPDVTEIYLQLAARSLDLAERNGADPADIERIREEIVIAERKGKC